MDALPEQNRKRAGRESLWGLTMEIIRSSEKQNEVEKESQEEVEGIH